MVALVWLMGCSDHFITPLDKPEPSDPMATDVDATDTEDTDGPSSSGTESDPAPTGDTEPNAPPEVAVTVSPADPYAGFDDLDCVAVASDADGDALTYGFVWTDAEDTVLTGVDGATSSTLDKDEVPEGDVTCTVTVDDGEDTAKADDAVTAVAWDIDAVTTIWGTEDTGWFGFSVAAMGDHDTGDSDDVEYLGVTSRVGGKAFLFRGPVTGDLNDVDADIIFEGDTGEASFGNEIARGGIYSDVDVVLASAYRYYPGAVHIFAGPLTDGSYTAADATLTLSSEESHGWLGHSLIGGVDIQGSSDVPFVLAGMPGTGGSSWDGSVAVLLGSDTGVVEMQHDLTASSEGARFGHDVGVGELLGAGDLAIIGDPEATADGLAKAGAVYVFADPSTLEGVSADDADLVVTGEVDGYHFGSVVTAGDVDGDGYEDLLVAGDYITVDSMSMTGGPPGSVYVFTDALAGVRSSSSSTLTTADADAVLVGENDDDFTAFDFIFGSDPDCDAGTASGGLIVGAPNYLTDWTGGIWFVADATASLSLDHARDVWLQSDTSQARFGRKLAEVGDQDGDGCPDVLVGAHSLNGRTGAAYVVDGVDFAD